MLNDAVRTDMANSVLCWLATVDADGTPNVSPKEIFASHGDDRIVIADIASPVSVKNLRAKIGDNPRNPKWLHTVHGVGYRFEDPTKQGQ